MSVSLNEEMTDITPFQQWCSGGTMLSVPMCEVLCPPGTIVQQLCKAQILMYHQRCCLKLVVRQPTALSGCHQTATVRL